MNRDKLLKKKEQKESRPANGPACVRGNKIKRHVLWSIYQETDEDITQTSKKVHLPPWEIRHRLGLG